MPATTVTEREAGPTLDLAQLEVRLGSRRLRLEGPCVLRSGSLHLIVGRSGSGKSSFARALLGFGDLSDPEILCRGNVAVTDAQGGAHVLWRDRQYEPASRGEIAFLPQSERLGFLDGLSLTDNLLLFSHLPPERADESIARLAEHFHISPLPPALASASGGERIRLSAIRGLLPRDSSGRLPAVVIADEPTAGLDPNSAASMVQSLLDLAAGGQSIVMVITHEPELFLKETSANGWMAENTVQIIECRRAADGNGRLATNVVGRLRLEPAPVAPRPGESLVRRAAQSLSRLGAVALAPVAFVWGLLGLHRPWVLAKQVLHDASGLGTQAFSLVGCLLVAGTVSYFIFERMPKPELVEPLLLPETLAVTGHALVRVVLPLGACGLVTAKLGAAQTARLAATVRTGLLETLALAGWRVEAYALVPAVIAQILAMALATVLSLVAGVILAAIVYISGHEGGSLPLAINLMVDGLDTAPHWRAYVVAKVVLSGFLGGTIAALYGIAPSRAEDDVARAVHRTLLWSVLAVIACQCGLILAEFAPK